MENNLPFRLDTISISLGQLIPELILSSGIVLIIFSGLLTKKQGKKIVEWLTLLLFLISGTCSFLQETTSISLFNGMIHNNSLSWSFKVLFDFAGVLTVLMSIKNEELKTSSFGSEYFALLTSAILGAHILTMTSNMVMIFLALEVLSISSYVLAGYSLNKKGSEGSLKYFLFGSVASAVMLYGFSILFGLSGSVDFTSVDFAKNLLNNQSPLLLVAGLMILAGFLYKIAAAPMHPWAPDVYEATPLPVVSFISVVPKLAGLSVLLNFSAEIAVMGQGNFDWQMILSVVAILSIAVGNLSALWQNNPKRMMAYSSIAQTGFLLIGVICFSAQASQLLLFYATVYLAANFAVFFCLQAFEKNNVTSTATYSGAGKSFTMISIVLLIGLIALAGIPPTAGFTAKLFIFTALWNAYEQTGKDILIWLLVFGLLNTVVSLFYYLKIPYYAFVKNEGNPLPLKKTQLENYLALLLVVLILFLFIQPDLLMGWLNRINFVL